MKGSPFHRAVIALVRWLRTRRLRRSQTRLVLMDGGRAAFPLSLDAYYRLTRRPSQKAGGVAPVRSSRAARPVSDPLSTG
jgi:hypothetical protein